jgi:large subunit ribosomal protein L31
MKKGIHPKYQQVTISCACGNTFQAGSTKAGIRVEICSKCHPFYTGQQRILDTGGQVERFMRRLGASRKAGAVATASEEASNPPA